MSNYKVGDIIRLTRTSLGISQEELSFGICSVQTLYRIENGKCSVKKDTYRKLMERMGRNGKRNFCSLYVDNFELLDLKVKADTALSKFDYEGAEKYINELKPELKEAVINKQYTMLMDSIINYRLRKISKEDYLKSLEDIMKLTIPDYNNLLNKVYPFMDEEVHILINISNAYSEHKNYKKSIKIMEMLLRSLNTGYMGEKDAVPFKIMLMNNMAKAYGELDEYEKAITVGEEGIQLAEKYKIAGTLANAYAEIAWDMIQQIESGERGKEELEICKKYLRQGYALTAVSDGKVLKDIIKKYYEEYFGEKIYFLSSRGNGESPNN